MELNTKFEVADEVWYFKDQIPTRTEIKAINIKVEKVPRLNVLIKYDLMRERVAIHEGSLFLTQAELYGSLE